MNNIDMVITLGNNTKYMILDQGNYNDKRYYLTSKLDEEENLTEEFNILEDEDGILSRVTDEKLFNALIAYFKKRFEVIA